MQTYPLGARIDQYEIASRPMVGGMGVVYFCLDHGHDGRPVALKTFKPDYMPDRATRDRFLREGSAWVNLGAHAHIVRCYSVEYIDPTTFMVLEPIAKEPDRNDASLRAWLGQPLPVEQALLFAIQIARGMQYAVEKIPGFVHRDLKPENLLVGADKLPGSHVNRLRVTDFGLAAVLQDEIGGMKDEGTQTIGRTHLTRGILGTPLYMAPEQWTGAAVGVYTDVYALGCILYEMLTGQQAADGHTLRALQGAHCAGNLRGLPGGLPVDVAALLKRCLALSPSNRYGDWPALTAALENVYAAHSGKPAPRSPAPVALSNAEQEQAGWSYNAIGLDYLNMGKAEVAARYFEQALAAGQRQSVRQLQGVALGNLGITYKNLGDPQRAIGCYEKALVIAREIGDRSGEGNASGNLGLAYARLGEAQRAIEYSEQSLTILREIGDRRGEGAALGNLGLAYAALGDTRRSIGYLEQGLVIMREVGDRRGEGEALGSLGLAYADLGDAQRAIGYYEQALVIAREIGDRFREANALGNLGIAYKNQGDAQRAIGYYEQQMTITREIGDLNGVATVSFNMALLYQKKGDSARAMSLAQEAAAAFARIGHPEYTQRAQQLIAQLQRGGAPTPAQTNLAQAAFEAFQCAGSSADMQRAVAQFPFMTETGFISELERVIAEQVPPQLKPTFEQRLAWLKQITGKQQPGLFGRLFGKKG